MKRLVPKTPPEERARILKSLFGVVETGGRGRFAFLMVLSIVVAVMGLSADSAAIVIGAMLIAPLMTPVIAFAAALAMGWGRRMVVTGTVVVVTSLGSIVLAWFLSWLLPSMTLTHEILSRTSPDVRDLIVALAAGAAGSYATAREHVSSALPGVAVAVALVPPLATIGVTLELGRTDLAEGAVLLYVANLAAIVLSSVAVLLVSGFVPSWRLASASIRVAGGIAVALAVTAAIGVPLALRSLEVADRAQLAQGVNDEVLLWLGAESALEVEEVQVDGHRVVVDLAGPEEPPSAGLLAAALVDDIGEQVEVQVRWSQRSNGVAHSEDATTEVSLEPDDVRPIVESWLVEGASASGARDRLGEITIDGDSLSLSVEGPIAPPPVVLLADAIEEETGRRFEVTVRWTEQRFLDAGSARTSNELVLVRDAAKHWAERHDGIDVLEVALEDDLVTVDLAGEQPPTSVVDLVEAIVEALGREVDVQVRFVPRLELA